MKGKQKSSRTLLEALALAINGTNGQEATRLAEEFNSSFGHLVRASVEAESMQGDKIENRAEPTKIHSSAKSAQGQNPAARNKAIDRKRETLLECITEDVVREKEAEEGGSSPPSPDESDVKKPKKKKKKKNASVKKQSRDSDSASISDHSSNSSSSEDSSSDDLSQAEDAELCYEITEFKSADLPDLLGRWDKGFRKLRSYVPLTLFNTALLESFYDDEGETKTSAKSAKSKSSLKKPREAAHVRRFHRDE